MRIVVYDASDVRGNRYPLSTLPVVEVQVGPGWSVADVLEAGGHDRYNAFTLVTTDVEADVAAGERHAILAAINLFGIDDRGAVRFEGEEHIRWSEFVRAVDAQLYSGDALRLVVYRQGVAGGLSPDGLWDAVQWLFANRDVARGVLGYVAETGAGVAALVGGVRWVDGIRRRQIAKQWRAQGFTALRIREHLAKYEQWDPSQFAKHMQLTDLEARLALTNAGYEAGSDGIWRPSETVEGRRLRQRLDEIEARAYADIEGGWSDDFPIDDDEHSEDETSGQPSADQDQLP